MDERFVATWQCSSRDHCDWCGQRIEVGEDVFLTSLDHAVCSDCAYTEEYEVVDTPADLLLRLEPPTSVLRLFINGIILGACIITVLYFIPIWVRSL